MNLDRAAARRLADLLDLAVDFATLGEYGVEPGAPGRPTVKHRAAACHRIAARDLSRKLSLSFPDERVRPRTAAGRRRIATGTRPGLASLQLQRRLGSGPSGRASRVRPASVRRIETAPSLREPAVSPTRPQPAAPGTDSAGTAGKALSRRSRRQAAAGQLELAVTA